MSNSRGIGINEQNVLASGPSSAVTLKYYRVKCALGLEDSFHPKGCAGLVYLLTEAPHIGDVECL